MRLASDRRVLLAGGVLTLGAGYLFVQHVFFTLSITVRAVLILGVALLMVCWAAAPGRSRELPALGMVLAFFLFVAYVTIEFPVPPILCVLAVPGSLVAVVVLAYFLHEGQLAFGRSTATYAILAIALVGAALVGIDSQVSDVEYTATLDDAGAFGNASGGSVRLNVGTATARSTFVFREPVSFPDAQACLYPGNGRQRLSIFYRANGTIFHKSVAGSGRLETRMAARVNPETAAALPDRLPVERGERCPPAGDGPPRIVVTGVPPTPTSETG